MEEIPPCAAADLIGECVDTDRSGRIRCRCFCLLRCGLRCCIGNFTGNIRNCRIGSTCIRYFGLLTAAAGLRDKNDDDDQADQGYCCEYIRQECAGLALIVTIVETVVDRIRSSSGRLSIRTVARLF